LLEKKHGKPGKIDIDDTRRERWEEKRRNDVDDIEKLIKASLCQSEVALKIEAGFLNQL